MMGKAALLLLVSFTWSSAAVAAAPAWVDGKDPRYKSEEFVIGVGKGPTRDAADIDARAEVARVFEARVSAVAKDFQSAATTVNGSGKGVSVEVQTASLYQQVTVSKALSAVELREHGSDGGTHFTLALLSRAQCIGALTDVIRSFDAQITAAMTRAEKADDVGKFKAYGTALGVMDEREGANAMLRVCDRSGQGVPPPITLGELASKFDAIAGQLKIGVDLVGSGAARVRDCLMEQLGNKGYTLVEIEVDESADDDEDENDEEDEDEDEDDPEERAFDLVIQGRLKSEKAGEIAGSQMVRTELVLKLVNPKTQKTLRTVTANRKEGRPSVPAAAALSAYKLCQKEMPNLVKEIDKVFKR